MRSTHAASTRNWCETFRNALDAEGFSDVRIVLSCRVVSTQIRFAGSKPSVSQWIPMASARLYSVASTELTADVVSVDGVPLSKTGRTHRPNSRLERVS